MTGGGRTLLNVALLVLLILFAISLLYAYRSQSPSPQSISPAVWHAICA